MDTEKMRRQLKRNQDAYQLRWLTPLPAAPAFPGLQRIGATLAAIAATPVRFPIKAGPSGYDCSGWVALLHSDPEECARRLYDVAERHRPEEERETRG